MNYYENNTPAPDVAECFASPDGQDLIADTFLPADAKRNGAAVVMVHGGGWNAGDRNAFLWHAHRLSTHGYVACTIDYRLSQIACYPAAVLDCQAAVRWLRENADRFQIEADRVGTMGSSAGGHLVACLGVMEDAQHATSSRANCVVDVHGAHELPEMPYENEPIMRTTEDFLGCPLAEGRDLWEKASPARYVDANSAPTLLIHDPQDPTVPYNQSLIFANALMAAARPVQFLPSPGSGHGFVYNPQNEWTQHVWPVAVAWLDHHLLNTTSASVLGVDAPEAPISG